MLPELQAKDNIIISAKDQVVTPAQEEKIYDKYWLNQFSLVFPGPNLKAKLVAVLNPCTSTAGKTEILDDSDKTKVIVVNDVLGKYDVDNNFGNMVDKIMVELATIGSYNGILKSK